MVESVVIIGLNSCKNRCVFCSPKGLKNTINGKKLKKIEVHLLKQVIDLKKRGFGEIEISGCDPIEYSKIGSFVKWLKEIGFKYVQLSTHGRNLNNLELVKELKNAKLDRLRIPLYGSNEAIHDSVTQSKGSFKETFKGIQNVREYADSINIKITSLIMKQNYNDILNIFSLASKYAGDVVFSIPCLPNHVDSKNIAVPFVKIKRCLISLINLGEKNKISLTILDVPFCIFGFYKENIINHTEPPATANTYKIPLEFKSNVPNLPSYRVKTKLKICSKCKLDNNCGGFYKKYTELFNLSYLTPL